MDDVAAISVLQEPVRRRLYEFVVAQGREVGRQEVALAVGVQRTLVAFHLDKLVDAGLLETSSRRLSGRDGPGAGRPAKLYRRAMGERAVSVPARDYRTAAELLGEAADAAGIDDRVRAAARDRGRALAAGESVKDLSHAAGLLAERGYAPVQEDGADGLRLRNCPFGVLAESFPPLVCGMNLALLEGLLEGSDLTAALDPRPGWCCVRIF